MHHFYSNPLSIFLSLMGKPQHDILTTLNQWSNNDITTAHHAAHIRMLRSFRLYIERLIDDKDDEKDSASRQEQQQRNRQLALRLINDDAYLMTQQLAQWLVDLSNYQRRFKRGMALIQFLQLQFPAFTGLGRKTRRLLYLEHLENVQWHKQADTLYWLVNLVRKMEATALGPFVKQLKLAFEQESSGCNEKDQKWMDQILAWQEQLETLAQADKNEMAKDKRREKKLEGMMSLSGVPMKNGDNNNHMDSNDRTDGMTTAARHTKTSEKVQENALEHLRQMGTVTSKIALEIADWFQSIFRYVKKRGGSIGRMVLIKIFLHVLPY